MNSKYWYRPDVSNWFARQRAQHEQTAAVNVGAYPVPLGGSSNMLRRVFPKPAEDEYTIPDEYMGVYGSPEKL